MLVQSASNWFINDLPKRGSLTANLKCIKFSSVENKIETQADYFQMNQDTSSISNFKERFWFVLKEKNEKKLHKCEMQSEWLEANMASKMWSSPEGFHGARS